MDGRRFDAGGGGDAGGDGVYGVVSITIVGEVMVWCVSVSHFILLAHSGPSGPTTASLNLFLMKYDRFVIFLPHRHLTDLPRGDVRVSCTIHWSAIDTLAEAIAFCTDIVLGIKCLVDGGIYI